MKPIKPSQTKKMKKLFSTLPGEAFEVANQMIFCLKVLLIGLLIPFTFILGISYKRQTVAEKREININKENVVASSNILDFTKVLPDQNA